VIRILTGTNNFALRAALRQAVDSYTSEHGDMSLERLDGEVASFERLQESLQSLPFLAARKLVVLDTPGANKQFAENAAKLLDDMPDTTDLIIVEPKLDKRSSYYKLLKKQKGYQEFGELDEHGLARWLVESARDQDVKLSSGDARLIVARAGSNQQILSQEIEKLTLYAAGGSGAGKVKESHDPVIDRAAIEALVPATPQSTIFQLLEAAFAGDARRAVELYAEQRALKVEPQQIIAMLAWQMHVIALVKAAGSARTPDAIAKDARMSPYVVKKSAAIARGLTVARTRQLISDLTGIDHRLKRESLDADDVLLTYLTELAIS
jgi:DNA polymerase-3 subunit delta